MMRYSSEEEREWKKDWEEFMKGKPSYDWKTCIKCFFYTKNPEHDQYRCHGGNCPALKRDKDEIQR